MKAPTEKQQELIQKLANATKTWYSCGGHGKAWSNECVAREYRATLEVLGTEIPDIKQLLAIGQFNGIGSY